MNSLFASIKLSIFIIWTAVAILMQIVMRLICRGQGVFYVPMLWHKVVCRIFGVRVSTRGTPVQDGQVMYVSNHVSYLDIPVLGGLIFGQFIAKKEVESWPLFGYLAKLQNTVFIDRSGSQVEQDYQNVGEQLNDHKNLILFPEGTSSDGSQIMPFRSRFFGLMLARQDNVRLQPITIAIPDAQTQEERDLYAWYGEMELVPHLWSLAKIKGIDVRVTFHDPVQIGEEITRKELTNLCYGVIAKGLK